MGVPNDRWFIRENPTKMDDDYGYPYFRSPLQNTTDAADSTTCAESHDAIENNQKRHERFDVDQRVNPHAALRHTKSMQSMEPMSVLVVVMQKKTKHVSFCFRFKKRRSGNSRFFFLKNSICVTLI